MLATNPIELYERTLEKIKRNFRSQSISYECDVIFNFEQILGLSFYAVNVGDQRGNQGL